MHLSIALALLISSVSGQVASPVCRTPVIRKEWRYLTKPEKKSFIDAVKCLGKLPGSSSFYATGLNKASIPPPVNVRSLYDDFVYSHMDTVPKTHFVGQDLWWHRMFLVTFEDALRTKCGYTGGLPYWDWSLDVANMQKSPVFDPDPVYGLGTFGTAASNWVVTDGAFANVSRIYPTPHVIKRRYQPQPFSYNGPFPFNFDQPKLYGNETVTPAKISAIIKGYKGDPVGFQTAMEGHLCQGPHNTIHLIFGTPFGPLGAAGGGDMADANYPANDIMFFLHHGNVDRIWQKWKDADPANTYALGGGTVQVIDQFPINPQGLPPAVQYTQDLEINGLAAKRTLLEFLTTTQGYPCYQYQDPGVIVTPTIITPTISIPTFTVPTPTIPTITFPSITFPSITIPTFTVPTPTIPTITFPTPTF